MRDHRIGLKNNTIISFGHGKDIRITGEVGRGAACIIYDAVYLDSIGVEHHVRLKECYPSYLSIDRDEQCQLIPSEHNHEKFETAKKDFMDAYRRNAKIRNTLGLVNSTINSTEIASCNHTIYIKMELDEGIDYRTYEDSSLKSLFLHIRSLAELIQKYHQNGYLYLNIKLENIFILPETEEHIILFDFDSAITLEELARNTEIELSFSIGFSPFEQVQGQIDKIGKHTDIYSIGALAFYKLFNRTAASQECKISSTCPFSEMKYADEKYNPKLYRALDIFFKKTLSAAITPRWHDMQQVIDQLEDLIKLSDVDEVYLLDSFQYDSACFVGRDEEIEEIADALAENQFIFLSGIGGIGKTELAKQYANKYRSQYDTVTFSIFEKNIETLVCDEILIHKAARDEDETAADYFERKIGILKQIATPRDLVIIDNFDVDSDEKLDLLFRCPCKFIITTRMDFSDYNYKQIYVDRLRNFDDVLGLFYTYNSKDYQEKESAAVEKLIDYVDRHTMTVELIAKYLRNSEELPTDLYRKFLQKEGTTNTGEVNVKQRKDFALRSKSVNDHLRILFDVSGFDPAQQEIIRSLSLLAGIRIEKSKFHELCAAEDDESHLELLIRNGWVEYHAESGKISLHQVIQDLVYKDLAPNAENCPRIVEGMEKYVNTEPVNKTKRKIQQRIFDVFIERLSGNNLLYANLCLKYGREDKLDEAEKICLSSPKRKSFNILQKIYMEKIRILFDSEQQIASIGNLLDKVIFYCRKVSEKPNHIVKEYMEIGVEVYYLLTYLCSHLKDWLPDIYNIHLKLMEMFDVVTEQLPRTSYSASKKEKVYREIQDFYSSKYYGVTYRGQKYSDLEKAYQYQEFIEQLKKDIPKRSILQAIYDMPASDLAREYEKDGDYEKAIEYYKKDCETEHEIYTDTYEEAMWRIAQIYFKTGDIDKGILSLEQIITHNRERNISSRDVYIELIETLIELKDFEKAKKYIEELLYHIEPSDSPSDSYYVTYELFACYFLYLLEQNQNQKNILWQNCLKYYEMLGDADINKVLYDFISEYVDKEEVNYEAIIKILNRIEGTIGDGENVRKIIIQHSIEKYSGRNDFQKYHPLFLIKLAELTNVDSYEDLENGQKNCEKAQEYYNKYKLNDEYIQSLIYKITAELMINDKNHSPKRALEIKKLCNYKLLAEQQISNHNYNQDNQADIWKNAALQYQCTNNYSMMAACILQALKMSNPMELDAFNFRYQKLMRDLFKACITINDFDSAYFAIMELYDRIMEYLAEYDNSDQSKENHSDDNILDDNTFFDSDDASEYSQYYEYADTLGFDGIIKWFNDIAKYFAEISKFDNAIQTYLIAMYLTLTPEVNFELLIFGDDTSKDIVQLCVIIDELLDEQIDDDIADPLVESKDGILECKDSSSVDAKIYESIIAKISKKYQYQDIEFKQQ